MEKVIRGDQVAVLYSPGYGAGWYSWHHVPELLFDPVVVELVETGRHADIEEYCERAYDSDKYYGGARDLKIAWLEKGLIFRIHEYDGNESIETLEDLDWITA